ncbi:metallophosphoesterase [Streptomyces sp. N2-109]|uniref:Metallophosphoesterase n=1 Tax=Streptomyces gossypii TaxID=2883101 RepID=A0ABT2K1Z0_9ACTN|nr:metallophosphoesterase [Streptomyces gossypii]MCT2594187.1 metallophosphoesterase [Streptomyces gossypii]
MFVFAHFSDIHLGQDHEGDNGERARERAARVLRYLDDLPGELDAVLLTGDIADHGAPEEYEEAAELLTSSCHTVLLCPGNHDVRGAYRAGLPSGSLTDSADPADASPVNAAHRLPGATFLMCDSSIPGRGAGYLDDTTLAWLDGELLAAPHEAPAFVCFHHPPVPLHGQYVDPIRQFGEERLAEVVTRHPHVAALLCGHTHMAAATSFAGMPLLAAPGVVSTLRMPWEGETPIDYELPPMLAFHIYDDDGRLTTHFRVVP